MSTPSAFSDLRMRASLYLRRPVPSHEDIVKTVNDILDEAERDRTALDQRVGER